MRSPRFVLCEGKNVLMHARVGVGVQAGLCAARRRRGIHNSGVTGVFDGLSHGFRPVAIGPDLFASCPYM